MAAHPKQLREDLKRLDALAYNRRENSEGDLERFYALRKKLGAKALTVMEPLHRWMLVPITLWPTNIHRIYCHCLDSLEAGKRLDREMVFLFGILPPIPPEEVTKIVTEHEHLVQKGDYEGLLKTSGKYDPIEESVVNDPEFQRQWTSFKEVWNVGEYQNDAGIIRRNITGERNLRGKAFDVDWSKAHHRFRAAFDAFCTRWNLYGMKNDYPLLNKLSVNLTALGTMIFIPAYWSFDAKRDVRWDGVMALHRPRAFKKQGEALAENAAQRRKDAAKLKLLDAEAKSLKLRGEAKHAYLCKGLGWDERTDPKRLARLRRKDFS